MRAVFLLYGHWWIGLVLLLARGVMDNIDGCLQLAHDHPHVLIVLAFGVTGSLCNVIAKLSIYAESQQDVIRTEGKLGYPIDLVGVFGSVGFMIYFGFGILVTGLTNDPRPALFGVWAVAVMSHLSLFQRLVFAWRRYRFVHSVAPKRRL